MSKNSRTGREAQAELRRLEEDAVREKIGSAGRPYLSERQWATIREDYSADGDNWRSFPHEHARSSASVCNEQQDECDRRPMTGTGRFVIC